MICRWSGSIEGTAWSCMECHLIFSLSVYSFNYVYLAVLGPVLTYGPESWPSSTARTTQYVVSACFTSQLKLLTASHLRPARKALLCMISVKLCAPCWSPERLSWIFVVVTMKRLTTCDSLLQVPLNCHQQKWGQHCHHRQKRVSRKSLLPCSHIPHCHG